MARHSYGDGAVGDRGRSTRSAWRSYANRSRGDLLGGGFGGVKRTLAQSQARKAALETLGTIKSQLEQAR